MLNPYEAVSKEESKKYLDEAGNVNPKTGVGKERRFDSKGKINAWDKKDALTAIASMLNDTTMGKVRTASYRKQSEMSPQERRDVMLAALASPEGMSKFGQSYLAPIKDIIDYEGWARKILMMKNIDQGGIHRITKDIKVVAFTVGQDGQSVTSQAVGKYVFPPAFKVVAYPEIDIQDVYQMNFDAIDREQDLAKQMIMLQEDKALVAALNAASTAINDIVYFTTFSIGAFDDIKYQVERHRLVADKFIVNRAEVNNLIKNMHAFLDPVTERELILMGYVGTVLNTQIITTAGTGVQEVVAPGDVYVTTDGGFLGEMGIWIDLVSEAYNKFSQQETKKGFAFYELISQAVVNPRAVAKGKRT